MQEDLSPHSLKGSADYLWSALLTVKRVETYAFYPLKPSHEPFLDRKDALYIFLVVL